MNGVITTDLNLSGSLSSSMQLGGIISNAYYRGYSAYEIAVQHGYQGTEEEWIAAMSDYEQLNNLPQIEGVTLIGNKTFADLGLTALTSAEINNILN